MNPFQSGVVFHKETSHLICTVNQMTGFFIKYNTGLNEFIEDFYIQLICDVLRDLVSFVQFKKREKHPRRSVKNFTKINTSPWVFFTSHLTHFVPLDSFHTP